MALNTGSIWTKDSVSLLLLENSYGNGIYSEAPNTAAPASWCKFNPSLKFNIFSAQSGVFVNGFDVFVSLEENVYVEDGDLEGNPILVKSFVIDTIDVSHGYQTVTLDPISPEFTIKNISETITYYVHLGVVSSDGYKVFNIGTISFVPLAHLGWRLDLTDTQTTFEFGEPLSANLKLYETFRYDGTYWSNNSEVDNIEREPTVVFPSVNASGTYTVAVKYNNETVDTYEITVSPEKYTDYVKTLTYKIATNVTTVVKDSTTFYFGKRFIDEKLAGESYPLFEENRLENGLLPDGDENTNKNDYCVGYVDFGINKNAHVVLFQDPKNPMQKENKNAVSSNITVTFPNYDSTQADRINKARFGIIYNNRLFVSGNPDFKNCDWHTQPINDVDYDTTHDYTYFSDLDYCYYGSDDTAVVGYDIFRDGDLIVVKEGARNQATLYRRTRELVNAMSYDGNSTVLSGLVEESFPMFDINTNGGEGGLSPRSITNYMGDTLVLTKTGLKALITNEDIKNNAKYFKSVSSKIDPKITKEDLENSELFSYKEKLLLTTSRGTYVGYYDLKDEEGYEWFFLSNFHADYFFEYDDELYFANDENGGLYRFPKDSTSYVDKKRKYIDAAGAYIEGDWVYTSSKYNDVIEEDKNIILLSTYPIYMELGKASLPMVEVRETPIGNYTVNHYIDTFGIDTTNRNLLLINNDTDYDLLSDEMEVMITDWVPKFDENTSISATIEWYATHKNGKFILRRPTTAINVYKIYSPAGAEISLAYTQSFYILKRISEDANITIKDVEDYENGKRFKTANGVTALGTPNYVRFATPSTEDFWQGVVTENEPVSAFYITVPYSFGTLSKMKNIWSWTIANDTDLASYMDVGYLTSVNQGGFKSDWGIQTTSGSRTLALDEWLNFNKIQFTSDLLPHIYVRYRTVPMVNFIRFMFKNEEDSNMVLSLLELTYSIGEFSRGTK